MMIHSDLFSKKKTAYEIYQCAWSSAVCSSDLRRIEHAQAFIAHFIHKPARFRVSHPMLNPVINDGKRRVIEVQDELAPLHRHDVGGSSRVESCALQVVRESFG